MLYMHAHTHRADQDNDVCVADALYINAQLPKHIVITVPCALALTFPLDMLTTKASISNAGILGISLE